MIKSVFFFRNGNAAVFDEHGAQIPNVQEAWLIVFLKYLLSKHVFDPAQLLITLPDGKRAELFQTPNGEWNWEVKT